MTIWLVGKKLDDIVRIPLVMDGKRLKVRPNSLNEVYDFYGIPVHYIEEEENLESKTPSQNIANSLGKINSAEHVFKDYRGKKGKFNFWTVTLWNKIPDKFKDVIFYHELIELNNFGKVVYAPLAHEFARKAEREYVCTYLPKKDQEEYSKFLRKMERYSSKNFGKLE
jgi:hypothetical protein